MRRKLPQGNSIVLVVLRSPFHRLLSGVAVELRYSGRRTGRPYTLPVQYARAGNRLVVVPQRAETKTWWRNFRTARPVTVRLSGRLHEAMAVVVEPGEPRWDSNRQLYVSRWRRPSGPVDGPLVEITLQPR